MSALRKFDDQEVLDKVLQVFWTHGYRGTSLEDLTQATGLRKGSLRNAFGNKEDLFLLALERYAERFDARLEVSLDDLDPRRALEGFLGAIVERMADKDNPRGCFSTYACIEWQDLPPRAAAKVAQSIQILEESLCGTVTRAQQQGMLGPDSDVRAIARFFLATTRGMAALHKVTGDIEVVRDVARSAMMLLPKT